MTEQAKIEAAGVVLKLKRIGNSTGIILPKDMLTRLNLKPGDVLYPHFTPDGGLSLSRHDPKFGEAMEIARRGMRKYRNALSELAK
jgi:putative addiction module antidote